MTVKNDESNGYSRIGQHHGRGVGHAGEMDVVERGGSVAEGRHQDGVSVAVQDRPP